MGGRGLFVHIRNTLSLLEKDPVVLFLTRQVILDVGSVLEQCTALRKWYKAAPRSRPSCATWPDLFGRISVERELLQKVRSFEHWISQCSSAVCEQHSLSCICRGPCSIA